MKILVISAAYPPDVRGGGELSTQILAEALARQGVQVSVLAAAEVDSREFENGVEIRRCASPNHPWHLNQNRTTFEKLLWHCRENWNPQARSLVREHIRDVHPDLIVTSTIENFGGSAWSAASSEAIKCVHILRSYYLVCWRGTCFKEGRNCNTQCIDCRIASIGRRTGSRYVDGVIGISDDILGRHLAMGLFPSARSIVLHNPLQMLSFGGAREIVRAPLILGFLGALSPNKGLEVLADSWKEFSTNSVQLVIGGTGNERYVSRVRRMMPEDVSFLGWVNSADFLDSIDFLIVPSVWREPFGRTVIEAFARGVPVIASRTGGIAEIVEHGTTGFLFETGSSKSLSEAIDQATSIDNRKYAEMSRQCFESANRYHEDVIGAQYLDYFRKVLSVAA
jgi:glycosyltransferase involved in cell wall biosynthesis